MIRTIVASSFWLTRATFKLEFGKGEGREQLSGSGPSARGEEEEVDADTEAQTEQ